jgi:dinuclear metal center YbgI/SA1388 family protein
MKVANLVEVMEAIAPTRFAAAWDNVGLIVGDSAGPLSRVLLAVDCTLQVVDEARRERCEAVVAYHPPLFEPTKRFCADSVAYDLARSGIAVYSPHTALDVAKGGTNDALADALGITDRKPLRVIDSPGPADSDAWGFGRVGALPPTRALTLIDRVKRALGVERALVAGLVEREVACAAVCAGSGGDLVPDAISAGAQLFLTGELKHHDALRAAGAGLTVVCTLHSVSERIALDGLKRRLEDRLPGVDVVRSRADREPFLFV